MSSIHIDTKQRSYDIKIGSMLRHSVGSMLCDLFPDCPSVMIVTDDMVEKLWLGDVMASFADTNITPHCFVFPNGENSKTFETVSHILMEMENCAMQRSSVIVALGGGVVGDMAGLAAALYMRGVAFIQVPTTLLSAQDSSVGGKTAVNLQSKNIVGAFWQPSLVLCDCDMLATLPELIFGDGMAEMIKHGAIIDKDLFVRLENAEHKSDIESCVLQSVSVKAKVVAQDELDLGLRNLLNFGHTIGHAIEQASDFEISHGAAVGAGMCIISRACEALGIAEAGTSKRLEALVSACGLPITTSYDIDTLYNGALGDKKRGGDYINLVLIRSIGDCYISREPLSMLRDILKAGV